MFSVAAVADLNIAVDIGFQYIHHKRSYITQSIDVVRNEPWRQNGGLGGTYKVTSGDSRCKSGVRIHEENKKDTHASKYKKGCREKEMT